MPKNDDGEFELILGNRQLLSVFFIVVVLLGVFFTMGYIVGRSSTPQELASTRKPEKPLVIAAPDREPAPKEQPSVTPAPAPVKETPPVPTPEPKKKAEAPKPEPPPRETPKPKQVEKAAPTPAPAPPAAKKSEPPPAGQSYLQLAATSQREGDIMVDVLKKKGFKARAAEIPEKPGTFRILVGPLESGDMNKMRADLQAAGFPGNAAIKRTF